MTLPPSKEPGHSARWTQPLEFLNFWEVAHFEERRNFWINVGPLEQLPGSHVYSEVPSFKHKLWSYKSLQCSEKNTSKQRNCTCDFSLTSSIMLSIASDSSPLLASLATMFLSLRQYSLSCNTSWGKQSGWAHWHYETSSWTHMWAPFALNWRKCAKVPYDWGCHSFCVRPLSCVTLGSISLEWRHTSL